MPFALRAPQRRDPTSMEHAGGGAWQRSSASRFARRRPCRCRVRTARRPINARSS